jgi:hypothetical protein
MAAERGESSFHLTDWPVVVALVAAGAAAAVLLVEADELRPFSFVNAAVAELPESAPAFFRRPFPVDDPPRENLAGSA